MITVSNIEGKAQVGTKVYDLLYDGIEGWKFTPAFDRDIVPLRGHFAVWYPCNFPHSPQVI
jgi:hypothetical protein